MPALDRGWEVAGTPPGACQAPPAPGEAEWLPATVPGTVAGALAAAGRPEPVGESRIDSRDWWFRTVFEADPASEGEEVVLGLDGIATVWEVHLNGQLVRAGESMFEAGEHDVGALLAGHNELAVCCRALGPLLERPRRPRARWRPRLAAGNLRFYRTSLHGRAPGFAPGPPPIGPWRPVTLERRRGVVARALVVRSVLDGGNGVLRVEARLEALDGAPLGDPVVELSGPSGTHRADLEAVSEGEGRVAVRGELVVPEVARWWPHTHGEPVMHRVRLACGGEHIDAGRVGFRSLAPGPTSAHDVEADGLDLHVNGARVFARGAVWTPVDALGLAPSESALRTAIEQARDAGMNLLRLPGTGVYESPVFHDLCDELGMLVWQDFMFANFDYPIADDGFRAAVEREVRQVLHAGAGRPSLAVLCGNSEVEQQVAMLGLDPDMGRGPLFGELLPALGAEARADAIYVPSAPCGGDLPFRPSAGVANYFGVGGYRRPLSDLRLARVRFASECLAFANLPDASGPGGGAVPRDVGSSWDFEDVRDHYLRLLYDVDPAELRRTDPERYAAVSRSVTGEVMAEAMGEWRRRDSPCGGALVLCLRDVIPGAGWGLVDVGGVPKVAYHHLRRALAPVATWTTDEGLDGIAVHVANDRVEALHGRLRLSLYRDFEQLVEEAVCDLAVDPHGYWTEDAESILGHFRDVGWAYRFGPPAQDAVVVSLLDSSGALLSQAVRFPAGRPSTPLSAAELGLEAGLSPGGGSEAELRLTSRRLAYGVRPSVPGFVARDDAFFLEPGRERVVRLDRAPGGGDHGRDAGVKALNLAGTVPIEGAMASA